MLQVEKLERIERKKKGYNERMRYRENNYLKMTNRNEQSATKKLNGNRPEEQAPTRKGNTWH